MPVDAPDGCTLSLYSSNRKEVGSDNQGEDLISVKAECSCGEWEELLKDVPIGSADTQGRAAWLTEHLLKEDE
jgi:hypothetical protein